MYRVRMMLLNTALLTAAALVMRSVGMAFQVYLSQKIGAAGIGLYSLVMSVSALAATVALSGIRFTATRLVAMELGRGSPAGARLAVRRCLLYALACGTLAASALWFGAGTIGAGWIGDARTVAPLRVLAVSLPAFSLTAVLSGYFTAAGNVIKPTAAQAAETAVRIASVVFALSARGGAELGTICSIIVAGGVAGEMVSFFIHLCMYLRECRRHLGVEGADRSAGTAHAIFATAVPLALSAYARVALTTVQNLLVPRGLRKHGSSSEGALADYGMIQGMVFPVITFPSAIFYSLAELLVPELTRAQVQGDARRIAQLARHTLRYALMFSLCAAAVLFRFSGELGQALYGSAEAGALIRALSPLVPIMYVDSVTDGMLRGLGQQMHSMRYNVLDSLLSLALVCVLLPRYAIGGYIFIIYFTEAFNFALSIHRLAKVARVALGAVHALKSAFCAFGDAEIAVFLLRLCGLPLAAPGGVIAAHIALSAAAYAVLLMALGALTRGDADRLRALIGAFGAQRDARESPVARERPL
ncbi:MAG: oligosaccharide flippase family protein [Oscillospiraceae bacterium]|jgi:stage V sporulation protein B|nr:oligosaccharide flippase family protein [Oscillospiraceae bacterium]